MAQLRHIKLTSACLASKINTNVHEKKKIAADPENFKVQKKCSENEK